MRVDIWSDISCPWCYLAQARFDTALAAFPHADDVEVVHRSFELDPTLKKGDAEPILEVFTKKKGWTEQEGLQNEARLSGLTKAEGLPYVMGRDHGGTFDMHRLLHYAKSRGHDRQAALLRVLYRANYAEQRSVFDDDERLVALAAEAGLDADAVRTVLADHAMYAAEVRADEREAESLGAHGVPFFVLDNKYALRGAQSTETYAQALNQAWTEQHRLIEPVGAPAAEACGPDGCPVPHARA